MDSTGFGTSGGTPRVRHLVVGAIPALVIGVVSAMVLWLIDVVSEALESLVWTRMPHAFGLDPASGWFIFAVLSVTGVCVGLVIWLAPGHGGHDSATVELFAPVVTPSAIPGVVLVLILGLAGGVSLGPESPIIALNTVIAVTILARFAPRIPAEFAVLTTGAATLGAMFGTPVAAALVLTGLVAAAKGGGELWDRLFLPLTAAAAAAVTMTLLGGSSLALHLPKYSSPKLLDLLTASLVAVVGAGIAVAGILVFPRLHRAFHALRHPLLTLTLGGIVLGGLGAIGGPLTLFKGLHQMGELVSDRSHETAGHLLLITLVKLAALLVSASAGFRGGRVFPAVFIGVAVGLLANLLMPSLPVGLAVGAGVLGLTLAVARDGWLALFLAVAVVGDIGTLPVLCIVVLPTWLLVKVSPEMIVHPTAPLVAA